MDVVYIRRYRHQCVFFRLSLFDVVSNGDTILDDRSEAVGKG